MELSTTPLTNGCCNDDPFSIAVLVCSDQWCVFCTPSVAIVPTCCNQLDSNMANLGHRWGMINSGVSFYNNSMLARSRWAFQVSQGSVDTSFRWGENCLRASTANLFRTTNTFCGTWYLPHSHVHNERTVPIIMAGCMAHEREGYIYTCGLKSDDTIVFSDPDFL